jgi:hypothetical protein
MRLTRRLGNYTRITCPQPWFARSSALSSTWLPSLLLGAVLLVLSGCSPWAADFPVTVTNNTGSPITVQFFQHVWTKPNVVNTLNNGIPAPMANNTSLPITIRSGSGGLDTWTVAFTLSGTCYYRIKKQCSLTSSDQGGNIAILLLAPDDGFSVVLPSSSSCIENFYRESTGNACPPTTANAAQAP